MDQVSVQVHVFVDIFWKHPSTRFIARILDPIRTYEMFLREEYWCSIPSLIELSKYFEVAQYGESCIYKTIKVSGTSILECRMIFGSSAARIKVTLTDRDDMFWIENNVRIEDNVVGEMYNFMQLEGCMDNVGMWMGYSKLSRNRTTFNVDPLAFAEVSSSRDRGVDDAWYDNTCINNFDMMCSEMREISIHHLDLYLISCAIVVLSNNDDIDMEFMKWFLVNRKLGVSRRKDDKIVMAEDEFKKKRGVVLLKMSEYEKEKSVSRNMMIDKIKKSIKENIM